MSAIVRGLLVAAVLLAGARLVGARDFPSTPIPDTLRLVPVDSLPDPGPMRMRFSPSDSLDRMTAAPVVLAPDDTWFRAPFGDGMITPAEMWLATHREESDGDLASDATIDYNRVDQLRLGAGWEAQRPQTTLPRFGVRLEYATGRKRWLWGVQVEQPLAPPSRFVMGASAVRRTDHSDLQQVDDAENTLALLLGRQDYRDYFEREGTGAYLAWRVPDLSTLSVHLRRDRWRSLATNRGTRSWLHRDRPLRDNPAIDDGETRSVIARSERLARQTHRTRGGFYHWIELERAGRALGGDFTYTRGLADLRSVVRLSPASSLSLRAVAGATTAGDLPRQKSFGVGGVDGLRAHAFSEYRGDQMVLGQSEVSVGLWPIRTEPLQADLQVIAFVDLGRAWSNPEHTWDVNRQRLELDGGFGIAAAEDELRVYFARNLRHEGDFVISVRLQRPF